MFGEDEVVAVVVNEYYMLRVVGGDVFLIFIGVVVVLVDKLDMIVFFFSIDVILIGFQDLYGLCCQVSGIVFILIDCNWGIFFKELLLLIEMEKENEFFDFFIQCLKYVLNVEDICYDVIEVVLDSIDFELYVVVYKVRVFEKYFGILGFKEIVEVLGWVIFISKKGESCDIKLDLFENEQEKKLFDVY